MGENEDLPFRDDEPPDRQEGEQDKRRLFERVMPEILKRAVERAVESGASRLAEGPENLRHFVQELKLPKEVLHYLYTQIDETKNGLYRVVAKEIRDVLEQTKFADELTKVLTKLSFEIKTEIRFIPNDAGVRPDRPQQGPEDGAAPNAHSTEGGGLGLPRPEVKAHVSVKDRGKDVGPKGPVGGTAPNRQSTSGAQAPSPGRRGREDT